VKINITRKSVFTRGEKLLSIVITVLVAFIMSSFIIYPHNYILDSSYMYWSVLKSRVNKDYFLNYLYPLPNGKAPILFIPIDDKSIEDLHLNWPLPRSVYADLIDKISQYKPRAIGIDILFLEKSQNELNDKKLADMVKKHEEVVLARVIEKHDDNSLTVMDPAQSIIRGWTPQMKQSRIGYVDLGVTDRDGVIRKAKLLTSYNDTIYYSFDVLLLSRYLKVPLSEVKDFSQSGYQQIGATNIHLDRGAMLINYININDTQSPSIYDKSSLTEILTMIKSHDDKELNSLINNKIVIVGVTATQAYERQKSPFGETTGPEIHINILFTLLSQMFLKNNTEINKFLILLIPCISLVILLPYISPVTGFIIFLLLLLSIHIFSVWQFNTFRIIAPAGSGMFALLLIYSLISIEYFSKTHKAKNRLKSLLLELAPVPEPVLEKIMERYKGKIAMGGEKVELTILFSDIRGYTTLSQNLDPREVMNTLNEFYSAMGSINKRNGGMLFDYMGDGQMVVFGADSPADGKHAFLAVKSALEMCQELTKLNEDWKTRNRHPVDIGIGINTGEVSLGFLGSGGSGGRKQFAAIGDTTNVASRIEGLTKQYKANILISESTFEKSQSLIEVEPLPPTKVKGKDEPIKIYKVTGFKKSNE